MVELFVVAVLLATSVGAESTAIDFTFDSEVTKITHGTALERLFGRIASSGLSATVQSPFRAALPDLRLTARGAFDLGFSGTLPFTLELSAFTPTGDRRTSIGAAGPAGVGLLA